MKKLKLPTIFIIVSGIWLLIFAYLFINYSIFNRELSVIEESKMEVDNLLFYERNVQALEVEYDNVSRQSYTTKSTAEFISMLPNLATGISKMTIENQGSSIENDFKINQLQITTESEFAYIANFIDFLERSGLPIQISTLEMSGEGSEIYTEMLVRVYKKVIEE